MSDMRYVYEYCDVLAKRELVNLIFDNNLYNQEGVYRIPTILEIFSHNHVEIREKNYLIYEKKRDNRLIIPPSGETDYPLQHLQELFRIIREIYRNKKLMDDNNTEF